MPKASTSSATGLARPYAAAAMLLSGALLLAAAPAAAQVNSIQVNLVVPSPTPYLSQWASSPSVALLMVTNNAGVDVEGTVTATLIKDDQVVATVPSQITRLPGQFANALDYVVLPTVTTFATPQIADWRSAQLQGAVAKSVARTGALPEGIYALCVNFQNLTPVGRTPYLVEDVQQCAEFQITNPQPPTLLLPADGATVTQQNPVFSWTPVVTPGVPVVQYQLQVVDVLRGQTPTRAIEANRPVFETTVPNVTSLPYPPSALPLEVGKRYAWRVRALAPGMATDFGVSVTPLGENEGRSEVFTFTRKALVAFMPVTIDTSSPPPSGPVITPSPFFNRMITGRLMYSFNPGDVPAPKQVDLSLPTYQNFQLMGEPGGNPAPPPPSGGFKPLGGQRTSRAQPPRPLAGVTVRLVVRYRTASDWLTRNPIRVVGGRTYTDEGRVVATATTTADGRFIMAFNDDDPTGMVSLPGQKVQQGSGEFVTTTNGPLARFYQLEVGDAHYLSPSDEITVGKGKSGDVGTLVSLVRKYRLRVHVIDRETGKPPAAGEYAVTIGRQQRPSDVPEDEGEGPRMTLGTASVIARKTGAGNQPVTFGRLVRNIGPADRYRVAFSVPEGSEANYALSSNDYANDWRFTLGGGPNGEGTYNETYDFNLIGDDTLYVTPLPPRFIGQVVDAVTLQPVDQALLVLRDEHNTARQLRRLQPSDKGKFVWDIPSTSGAAWSIDVVVPGYETTSVGVPTRRGYRRSQTIAVQPGAIVRGEVQAPDGSSVAADAWFGPKAKSDVAETKATPRYGGGGGGSSGRGFVASTPHFVSAFELRAPARTDTLHVQPTAGGYCGVALVKQLHHGVNDLGAVTVPREDRKISVQVMSGTAPPYQVGVGQTRVFMLGSRSQSEPIPGAVVEAVDVYEADGTTLRTATAGRDGRALLHLGPGAKQVKIRVRSSARGDFETRTASVVTTSCGDPALVTVFLPPASRIAGTVYQGPGTKQPLRGAQVSIDGLPGLTATTDSRGQYVLRNVPREHVKLRAGGVNSGAVAADREMDVSQASYQGVDFHLGGAATAGLDWSRGLLGFDVSLSSVKAGQNGTYTVSGELVSLKANPTFATRGVDRLPFDDVVVRPDSAGHPVPVGDSLAVGATSLPLRLFGHYDVRQANTNGLVVHARKGVGAVTGPVAFEEQLIDVDFVNATGQPAQPALVPAAGAGVLATVTADGAVPGGETYHLAGADGGRLRFHLYGFRADAAPDSTTLSRDSLRMAATVHTAIQGVQDLALPAPGLTMVPGPDGGVAPFHTDHAIQRSLQKWTLRVDGWSLANGMAHLAGGELDVPVDPKTGAGVSLPLVSIRLLPDGFQSATFRDAPLSLGGMVDLDLSAKDLSFNRDGSDGPWRIYASTGASIPALPGMRPTDKIPLGLLKMQSDGVVAITPQHGTTVRLFDAADFQVASVVPGNQTLTLGGALDAAIPNVAPQTHSIIYRHDASGLHFDMVPIDIGPVSIGGAQLRIENAVLDSTGLHGGGYVEVPGKFRVSTRFVRTPPSRGDTVEAIPVMGATIDVGQIAVSNLSGGSQVRNGQWQTKFGGELHVGDNGGGGGSNGGSGGDQVGGQVTFAVEGADVDVGTAGLDIRNIQTPFGNLTISVNFPQQRLEGNMNIDGDITKGLHALGNAQMVISGAPSNRYWYVYAGLGFQLDKPKLTGTAAFIVGDATLGGQLLADFNQYSVHGVPPSFYRIRGFFLEGQVNWPVPVCPSGGFDIGVASVGIWCNVYGDLRMGMNFQEQNTYMIGAMAGVDVGANGSLGLGLCVSLWGEVKAQAEMEGGYRSDGAWYVLGNAFIDLHGGASYGVGIDDVCLNNSTNFTIGLGAEGELGHNWNTGEGQYFRVHFR